MRRFLTLIGLGLCTAMGATAQVVSTYPYAQDFENFSTCSTTAGSTCTLSEGWENATNDELDWTVDVGGTVSGSTGPSVDHTLGTSSGKYLYLETSTPAAPGDSAYLVSPYFDFTAATSPQLTFWYHMYGATMGTMHFDVEVNGVWTTDFIPSWTDNQDLWQQMVVDMSSFGGQDSVRFRMKGVMGSSFTSDMAVDDFLMENIVNNNIAPVSINSPVAPFTPGLQPVSVTIENFGGNTVTSAMLNWEFNGVPQTAVPYAGSVASGATDGPLALGSVLFPIGPSIIKIWTSMPNGVTDGDVSNDTLEVAVCTGLTGTITVGTGGLLPDLTTAVTALYSCGLLGPVTFEVLPGTYNEPILLLGPIPGGSSVNTVTFDGGDAAGTIVTYDGTNSFGTVSIDGASYVTVKNMTINSTATSDAWGVILTNGAMFNTVDSCVINIDPTLTSDAVGVAATGSYTAEFTEGQNAWYTTVSNCTINGGDKSIHFEGASLDRIPGLTITNNTLLGAGETGIYVDDVDTLIISGNYIGNMTSTSADGIYLFDIVDFQIDGNQVYVPDYGIYVSDGNFDATATLGYSSLTNNMSRSETDYAIYLDDIDSLQIFHNTAYGEPGMRVNDLTGVDIRNNIFVSNDDYAFEYDDAGPVSALNYNIYYTPATNSNFVKYGASTISDVYADLAAWQTAFPAENINSLEGNPVFVDNLADLHISGTLPNDAGDNSVGITTDVDGDTRPQAPSTTVDIGADEYTPLTEDLKIVSIDSVMTTCGLGTAEMISITVSNLGVNDVTGAQAAFSINGGAYTAAETIPGTIASGATVAYTFTATGDFAVPGQYTISAYATSVTPPDQNTSNDTTSFTFTSVPTISSFPYLESFENGQGGWSATGTNSTWAFGTPAKDVIQDAASGVNAWTTGGLGLDLYAANENSAVVGPCFDMTNAPAQPWVAMSVWWEAEFSWDGANLQSSTDAGATWTNVGDFGDPNNWYTDDAINGAPGGSQTGWTGRDNSSDGSGGWVIASHPLDPTLVGQPNVLFRVAFGSDGSFQDDGFAFDNFAIGELPTVSLGPDTATFCIGSTLTAGDFGGSYSWSTGDSTASILLTNNTGAAIVDSMIWLSVVDSLGLRGSDTIYVTIPASNPSVIASATMMVSCNGDSTGEATAAGTGGTGTLSYMWNTTPMQTTAVASMLPAGSYEVTVMDSIGCMDSDTVVISEPTAIAVAVDSLVNPLCAGDANGEIMITTSGGTMPYSYSWDNGDTTEDLTGLTAGAYVGTITDGNGCVFVSGALPLTQPDSLAVRLEALTDASCPNAADGSIDITSLGGTTPYSYSWDNGETTEDLTAVEPGDYVGTITDANGCVLVSPVLTVGATDSLTVAAFDFAFQNGETVDFSNMSSANATSYTWDFGDGNTSTDANPSNTYAANGTYTVCVTATGPCGDDTDCQTVEVTSVNVDQGLARFIQVYPNPSNGAFTVSFEDMNAQTVVVSVYNVHGQEIVRHESDQTVGSFRQEINIRSEAEGTYLLKIEVDGNMYMKQIMKR